MTVVVLVSFVVRVQKEKKVTEASTDAQELKEKKAKADLQVSSDLRVMMDFPAHPDKRDLQ